MSHDIHIKNNGNNLLFGFIIIDIFINASNFGHIHIRRCACWQINIWQTLVSTIRENWPTCDVWIIYIVRGHLFTFLYLPCGMFWYEIIILFFATLNNHRETHALYCFNSLSNECRRCWIFERYRLKQHFINYQYTKIDAHAELSVLFCIPCRSYRRKIALVIQLHIIRIIFDNRAVYFPWWTKSEIFDLSTNSVIKNNIHVLGYARNSWLVNNIVLFVISLQSR